MLILSDVIRRRLLCDETLIVFVLQNVNVMTMQTIDVILYFSRK